MALIKHFLFDGTDTGISLEGNAQVNQPVGDRTAAHFDGGSETSLGAGDGTHITADSNLLDITSNTQSFTLGAWIKPTSITQSGGPAYRFTSIFSKGMVYMSFGFESDGRLKLYTYNAGAHYITSNNSNIIQTNEWQHVVLVSDGGTISMYHNGVSVPLSSTALIAPSSEGTNVAPKIGHADTAQPADGFIGHMDEFRVYDHALSASEVATLHSTTAQETDYLALERSSIDAGYNGETTHYLSADSGNFAFGTDDFTIECYLTVHEAAGAPWNQDYLFDFRGHGSDLGSHTTPHLNTWYDPAGGFQLHVGSPAATIWGPGTPSAQVTPGTRVHYALVRENGQVSMYLDGTVVASAAMPQDLSADYPITIGANAVDTHVNHQASVTLENLRIYNGYAKTIVPDTLPPVITVLGDSSMTISEGTTYTDAGATAVDDTDGTVPVVTTGGVAQDASGAQPGVYTITYTAIDAAGNSSTETRTVVVERVVPSWANGMTKRFDFSGNANDEFGGPSGTLEDPNNTFQYVADNGVMVADFDGDNYVNLGNCNLSGSWTIATWIKTDSLNADKAWLSTTPFQASQGHTLHFVAQNGGDRIRLGYWSNDLDANEAGLIPLGVWTHVVMSYDSSADWSSIYVNGALKAGAPGPGPLLPENGSYEVVIGSWPGFGVGGWDGKIGHVAIWEGVALDAQGVYDLHALGRELPAKATLTVNGPFGYNSDSTGDGTLDAYEAVQQDGEMTIPASSFSITATDHDGIDLTNQVEVFDANGQPVVFPDSFPIGLNYLTFVVVGESGAPTFETRAIMIVDTMNPNSITIPEGNVGPGSSDMTMVQGDFNTFPMATATDLGYASNTLTWSISYIDTNGAPQTASPGDPIPATYEGITTYTYIVTDGSGNSSTADMTVTVMDNGDVTPPTINLLGSPNEVVEVGSGPWQDAGVFAVDNFDGVITNVTVSYTDFQGQSVGSIDTTALGSYNVIYSVSDTSFNTATISRTVTIVDSTAPEITILGENPVLVEIGSAGYSDAGATALDAADGDSTGGIITSGSVNTNVLGNYSIIYSVTDTSGNTATATRTVVVADTTAPVIVLNGDAITSHALNSGPYVDAGAVAIDSAEGDLTSSIVTSGSVNADVVQDYFITYEVSDSSGNTATATRKVSVVAVVSENNLVFSDSKNWQRMSVTSVAGDNHVDNGTGINVDEEHAVVIKAKEAIVASIRSERDPNKWRDILIPSDTLFSINVSRADLLNLKTYSANSAGVKIKSINRAFSLENTQLEDEVDAAEGESRAFKWLPKITVISNV